MPRPTPSASSKLRLVYSERTEPGARQAASPSVPAPLDDYELLTAVRSGDDAAATHFYRRVRPQVDATVHRMLGTRDSDLEDIAQVSLIELVKSIHTFRGECSLDSWVSRVTAHVVCKQIRRRRLERGIFAQAPADVADSARSANALVARNLLERIRGHLAEMEPGKALAFVLHDVCGFDLKEAAQILEVSVAATQKRLVRGRREVRERLAADPDLVEMLMSAEGEGS
jgi:RNA polymerase sigma-70 factor (ECF subfamily)